MSADWSRYNEDRYIDLGSILVNTRLNDTTIGNAGEASIGKHPKVAWCACHKFSGSHDLPRVFLLIHLHPEKNKHHPKKVRLGCIG